MYSHITTNKRKTVLLISLFSVVIIALGWFLGTQYGEPRIGVLMAVILSTVFSLVSYFAGDKAALLTTGAKRLKKEDHPELWRLVENLAITAGVPMPKLYLVNDPSPNAFATGRNPEHASVAVTIGLLQILEKKELEGVLAHELSHVKNYDILVMTVVIILVGSIALLSDILLRSIFFRGGDDRKGGQAAIVLAVVGLVLAILSPLIAEIIKLAVSRQREYLADASGALLTRYPEGLASALEKIRLHAKPMKKANHATAHLFISSPFLGKKDFLSLFSTHPPMEERVRRLRGM